MLDSRSLASNDQDDNDNNDKQGAGSTGNASDKGSRGRGYWGSTEYGGIHILIYIVMGASDLSRRLLCLTWKHAVSFAAIFLLLFLSWPLLMILLESMMS